MKSLTSLYRSLGAAALVFGLSACAANQSAQEHKQHHPANTPAASSSSMQGGMMQGGMMGGQGMMDMKAMCEMHSQMFHKSPEERQKMMESQGGNMSPEMLQQHMNMMNEKCR